MTCPDCHRSFYGQACFDAHKSGQKPLCQRWYKCLECCKVYDQKKPRVCYKAVCGNCGFYKDVNHRCYIQPYVAKKKKTSQKETEEHQDTLENSSDEEENLDAKPEPLIVAFDIDCAAKDIEGSEDKVFEPVLIGWSYLGVANDHESTSTPEFLAEMRSHTEVKGKPRQVYCFAHNLRALDGLIIQEELYRQGYTIEKILNQDAKYLSFECDNLIFRDSLNFFNMPLEKLSSTLNLQELHKGFFAYSWISESNAGYVSEFPPAADCRSFFYSGSEHHSFADVAVLLTLPSV